MTAPDLMGLIKSHDQEDWQRAQAFISTLSAASDIPHFSSVLLACIYPNRYPIFKALLALDNPSPPHEVILAGACRNLDVELAAQSLPHVDQSSPSMFFDCLKALKSSTIDQEQLDDLRQKQCTIVSMMLEHLNLEVSELEREQYLKEAFWMGRQDLFNVIYPYGPRAKDLSFDTPEVAARWQSMEDIACAHHDNKALSSTVEDVIASKPSLPSKKM